MIDVALVSVAKNLSYFEAWHTRAQASQREDCFRFLSRSPRVSAKQGYLPVR
jgi:hypothetical protein